MFTCITFLLGIAVAVVMAVTVDSTALPLAGEGFGWGTLP